MSLSAKTQFHQHIEADGFRLRGLGFSRLDAFSDVIFGFALTLLVVSLEVPKNYTEMRHMLRGFFPFGICFLFLMMVWYAHYKFFRRFHLHDLTTIALNSLLLFVVMFYVYPLKFLFTFLTSGMGGNWSGFFETYHQLNELMVMFGLGFASIYLLIGMLYVNAYRQRAHLDLTEVERFLARSYIVESLGVCGVGLLSCLAAWGLSSQTRGTSGYAGMVYWLIAPFKVFCRSYVRKKVAAIRASEHLPPLDPATAETI